MALINYSGVCWLVFALCHTIIIVSVASDSTEMDSPGFDSSATESRSSGDGVRCYCNTASCVTTGYMCRATSPNGCYSELTPKSTTHNARFGCLQHLADSEEEAIHRCQNEPSSSSGSSPAQASKGQHNLLLCCFRDLCNHEDSPLARFRLNRTIQEGVQEAECVTYSNSEVWLKAATIAVPVCGAIILFLLVAIAMRMLKADQKLSGPYMSHQIPPHCPMEDKKLPLGNGAGSPLLVQAGSCLVRVDRVELSKQKSYDVCCDIER